MTLLTPRRLLALALLIALTGVAVLALRWQPGPWARAHHETASDLARAGRLADARRTLRVVLERLPQDREARWAVIQLELRDRRREQAYLELIAYTELFPDRAEGWSALANLLQTGGLPDEALAAADFAVAATPQDAAVRAQRARIRAQLGRRAGARRDIAAAVAAAPDDAELLAWQQRIHALPPPPSPPPADRIRDTAPRRHGALTESHAMVWPGSLAQLRRDADQALQRGDPAAARVVAAGAEREFPGSVIGPWLLGVTAMAAKDHEEAERQFRAALARAPRSALVAKALAQVWQQRGSAETAARGLETLAANDPGFAFARRHAAATWLAARQPDRAEATLRSGVERATDAGPWRDLALFHQDLDRPGDALQVAAEGERRHPDDVELKFLHARLLAAAGQDAAAIARLEPLLRSEPDRDADFALLVRLLAARGTPADRIRAHQLLEMLEREAPTALASVDAIGWSWTLTGTASRGLPWLEAAVRAAPDRPDLRYHLATAHARLGDRDAARRELDAALASGKPFAEQPEAQKLRRRL